MKITVTLVSIFILHSCIITDSAKGQHFADDLLPAHTTMVSHVPYRDRRNKAEPTCEELRAMWRYSKRQSRAAEITNDLPMYRDPFSYNIWETYPVRSQSFLGYRDEREEQARNRGGGRAPVYGKMIHKAPAESRLRNGKPNRIKAFEEVAKMYGTINRQPPDSRISQYNFRVGGGSPHVSQAGSFQHLKELIRTERARELQDQRIAEEIAARAAAMNDITKKRRRVDESYLRRHNINLMQPYQEPKNVNYHFGPSQYVPSLSSFSDNLLGNDGYNRNSMLH
ncbi:hypothetical protein PV327_002625 [Microctonus hyperodae]|uniref:Uncharacterized protein n=1 Tax=Microctonus hyperodae TaxID=165561 RepID=A0AA39FG35_MICHY|nr:hypothetical protein PV327_002625 [Microctonus hyperodae]